MKRRDPLHKDPLAALAAATLVVWGTCGLVWFLVWAFR